MMKNRGLVGNPRQFTARKKIRCCAPKLVVAWLLAMAVCVFPACSTAAPQGPPPPVSLKSPSTAHPQQVGSQEPTGSSTPSISPTQPTPPPITPLPTTVKQQVAVLEAHDRFFYHGNLSRPEIALTFDDGPNPPYTTQVLALLQHYRIHATFFCMGKHVQSYPDLVRQEYLQGNLVENHTWSHPYLPRLSVPSLIWQLSTTADIIARVTGVRPTLFRPPYGAFNASVLQVANQFGLTTFIWTVDPEDWSTPGTNTIIARVLGLIGNGSIVLLHDGGGDRSETVAALPVLIDWLQRHGYVFVTLKQLVQDMHKNAASDDHNPTAY